jgi:hypothetical protein
MLGHCVCGRFASPAGGTCYWKKTLLYSCEARNPIFQRIRSCDTPAAAAAPAAAARLAAAAVQAA